SSRRRHTRWPRDWSSDVCSSDLAAPVEGHLEPAGHGLGSLVGDAGAEVQRGALARGAHLGDGEISRGIGAGAIAEVVGDVGVERSEERRVGKEWRGGWGREERRK